MSARRPIPRWLRVALLPPTLVLVIPVLALASVVKLLAMAITAVVGARRGGDEHVE